jgi:hypothetical protein
MEMPVPDNMQATLVPDLHTTLPITEALQLNPQLPLLLYHAYQIDPEWFSGYGSQPRTCAGALAFPRISGESGSDAIHPGTRKRTHPGHTDLCG